MTDTNQPRQDELRQKAFKMLDGKTFRYGTAHSTKHGVNISDAKHIIDWVLKEVNK